MVVVSRTLRSSRIYRARQIIVEHPDWGRRRINKELRWEFGRGLRDKDVDLLTKPQREARKAGLAPEITSIRPRKSTIQRVMKDAGFLNFEIYGVRDSPAKGLGQISYDSTHPYFRQVMDRMIRSRRREHQSFLSQGERRGWSKAKINSRWRKRIIRYYQKGIFPIIGGAVARGGKFLTPDGKPSPWALYKAWELRFIRESPFGGEAWGTPRPEKRVKRDYIPRPVAKSAIEREIRRHEQSIRELEQSIQKASREGNIARVRQFESQRGNLRTTINRLKREL